MIERSYLALYLFSVVFCAIIWLCGTYVGLGELVSYALFYGMVLPSTYMLATFVKWLICKHNPKVMFNSLQVCPLRLKGTKGLSFILSLVLSYSLTIIMVLLMVFLFSIEVTVEVPEEETLLQLAPLAAMLTLLFQVPVGTMEEGVFRQALPESLALLGGIPLFYAFSMSLIFGLLHLWAYQSIFLCVSAMVVGMTNSLIYWGIPFSKFSGNITALSLAHSLYNMTVTLFPFDIIKAFVLPASFISIMVIIALYYTFMEGAKKHV